ncbi:OSH3 [[Candida] subhashii]|uniref:OSH3 n=1 Tax=[Candida] subhashii TaxID=561895 RepID=A0A8J5UUR0_9ASCO|nr:OSH3 [[Candida] subhashii]KAG7666002.1 OSH3 [[Candida] subhashii]
MEKLEVHSKDFLIKWINAPDNSTIEWEVRPLKRSINFAIYKKETDDDATFQSPPFLEHNSRSSSVVNITQPPSGASTPPFSSRMRSTSVSSVNKISRSDSAYKSKSRSATLSTISQSDLSLVKNYHRLLGKELVRGKFEVSKSGMYAFVFDNSFSKTVGKTVTFSARIITHEAAPNPIEIHDAPSLDDEHVFDQLRPKSDVMQSIMLKKGRKKLQGFSKRYFILNFKNGTLSYFRVNDNKLRGQMPIKESIVSANPSKRELIIDSGMEVWHLKTINKADFNAWVNAFNAIKQDAYKTHPILEENESNQIKADLQLLSQKMARLVKLTPSPLANEIALDIAVLLGKSEALITRTPSLLSEDHSIFSGDFFDAEETFEDVGVVIIEDGEKPQPEEEEQISDLISSSSEDEEETEDLLLQAVEAATLKSLSRAGESEDLYPLPHPPVKRTPDIAICTHTPPSILSFVRKNVGKDLSTIAMPVTYNEPTTALQKFAEILEYSDVLSNALKTGNEEGERLLRIATFALTYLSTFRIKERSKRKPFTPLLGETYELVREDLGFRMISEKVVHRPPVYAYFAESDTWTLRFAISPTQKFWGKHSEVNTKGKIILTIKETGEVFTWSQPTTLVKNIIAGETYAEPSGSITVKSSNGLRAIAEFSKGGMFSGRSEGVVVKAYDEDRKELPLTVTGNWTDSFTLKAGSAEKCIWEAGELLPQTNKKYGFTSFAGTLNVITDIEKGLMAPTDSRLRPDLQHFIRGDVDTAEDLKLKLEQEQRERRKLVPDENHVANFFRFVGTGAPDEGDWEFIEGDNSYWNRRKNQNWEGLLKLW